MKEGRRRVGGRVALLVQSQQKICGCPTTEFLSGWCVCVVRMSTCTCVLSIYPRPLIFAGVNQPYRRVHRTLVPQSNMTRFARTTRHLTPPSYRWLVLFSKLQFYSKKGSEQIDIIPIQLCWLSFYQGGGNWGQWTNLWPEIRIHSPNQMIDQLWHILKSK